MATFRIHEDQENLQKRVPQKENNMKIKENRTVLGILDSNQIASKLKEASDQLKPKQELKNAKPQLKLKKPSPQMPIAQFESFKVYEDQPENEKNTEAPSNSQKVDKKDVESVVNVCHAAPSLTSAQKINHKLKLDKDVFFEMEEYRQDIYAYLKEAEMRNRPKALYMKKQPDITYSMRTILVDWLVEVAEEYRLQNETLYLTVSYIDRFLSYMSVVRAKLQLVGTAAMFIASKYEEIYPPDVGEFVYITDDTYTKKQVLRMEQLILKVLSFDLSLPTALTFLTKMCVSSAQEERIQFAAMYACELTLLEADPYLQFSPSLIAAAALCFVRQLLNVSNTTTDTNETTISFTEEAWPKQLEEFTGYSKNELEICISHLEKTLTNAPSSQQQAIQEKYKSSKYLHVSMMLDRILHEAHEENNFNRDVDI